MRGGGGGGSAGEAETPFGGASGAAGGGGGGSSLSTAGGTITPGANAEANPATGRSLNGEITITYSTIATPALSGATNPSQAVPNQAVVDDATLSGGNSPTGTLTFDVYDASDTSCSAPLGAALTSTVTGDGSYTSPAFTTSTPGAYQWTVAYSGDTQNGAVAAACNAGGQAFTVAKATSVTSAVVDDAATSAPWLGTETAGSSAFDTATVSGSSPTGTLTYSLFANGTCACAAVSTQTVTLSGGTVPTSNATGPLNPRTYSFSAVYNGDTTNSGSTSGCQSFSVLKATTVSVSPSSGPAGSTFAATVSGFLPGETVDVAFNGVLESTCTADTSGACTATIAVPTGPPGAYTVSARGTTSGLNSSATFTETTAVVALSPSSGPAGSTFVATVSGFLPGETVAVSFNGVSEASCASDTSGACTATVTVPSEPGGPYTVNAHGTSSGLNAKRDIHRNADVVVESEFGSGRLHVPCDRFELRGR